MTGVSSDDDDFEAGATQLSKTPSPTKLFRLLLSFSSLPRTTFPHKLHNDDGITMRNNKEMMKLESLLVSKRKRVKKLVLSMWVPPVAVFIAKGESLRSVDVSPPTDQERLPTSCPEVTSSKFGFSKKKTRVLQGRKRIERHTERRSRTVHNWHAAGGFQCPPPLCKGAQQQQNAFTATSRGQPTPPPKGGRSTPVRPSVVVVFAFVCKFHFILCVRSF
jgi:hypothetical protein